MLDNLPCLFPCCNTHRALQGWITYAQLICLQSIVSTPCPLCTRLRLAIDSWYASGPSRSVVRLYPRQIQDAEAEELTR